MSRLPTAIVRVVVISQKLSKIGLDTPMGRYSGFNCKICATVNAASCATLCCQSSNYRLADDDVNCYKWDATLGICCSLSSSIVLTSPKLNRKWTSFFSAFYSARFLFFSLEAFANWVNTLAALSSGSSWASVMHSLHSSLTKL